MTDEETPKRKTALPKEKSAGKSTSDSKPKSVSKAKMMAVPSVGSPSVETDEAADMVSAPVDRQLVIEREAYLRAERRGFEPGHELEDWLAAEHSLGAGANA
jgi:hypothetical protein